MPPSVIKAQTVSELKLDPQNPRLPEALQGALQSTILRHLFENDTLEEIAQSYIDNGFFPHEPLIVLEKPDKDGLHPVLEGNRRLAALKILLQAPEAEGLEFAGIEITAAQAKALERVPCFTIPTRDEVHAYLGFRHIGGIKTWKPEAKARYLLTEIDKTHTSGSVDPFKDVSRRVGSNALGVRNPYIAIKILQFGRDEYGIESNYVQQDRFGVWLRAMNSPEIRQYIGLGDPRTYSEVQEALRGLKRKRLAEVLGDLAPKSGRLKALLADSRDVTNYGRVIAHDGAREVLRKSGDIDLARQVLDRGDLAGRVARITASCKVLLEELHGATLSEDAVLAIKELHGIVRTMRAVAEQGGDE
jgi:hypothetical protein